MKRVVFDTNVLISAFASPGGVPGQLYDAWNGGGFVLILSPFILREFSRIAQLKLDFSAQKVRGAVRTLAMLAEMFEPDKLTIKEIEPGDVPIIGTAVAGRADVVVTGDKLLLKLKEYQDIRVVSPRAFLQELN